MNKNMKNHRNFRMIFQSFFVIITNSNFKGFLNGTLYTGNFKKACLPGLNCHSCPGSLGSCPIGALQSVLSNRNFNFSFYIAGFFMIVGTLLGRVVCGWLCPFGLFQDLLYKIKVKKILNVPLDKYLRLLKIPVLLIFVILIPMFYVSSSGGGEQFFCRYVCPSGSIMASTPLYIASDFIRSIVGFMFRYKMILLLLNIVFSILIYRPFCKYICPLGLIYGFFNKISMYRFSFDYGKCKHCDACSKVCKMGVSPNRTPNSIECIRCGDCLSVCPSGALKKAKIKPEEESSLLQENI